MFLLDVDADAVLSRIGNDTSRPLLQREDKETAVKTLMSQRMPLYNRAADYVVNAAVPPWHVCGRIIDIYNSVS